MNSESKAVELQDRAATRIYEQTRGMSREQELKYWRQKRAMSPYKHDPAKERPTQAIREKGGGYGR